MKNWKMIIKEVESTCLIMLVMLLLIKAQVRVQVLLGICWLKACLEQALTFLIMLLLKWRKIINTLVMMALAHRQANTPLLIQSIIDMDIDHDIVFIKPIISKFISFYTPLCLHPHISLFDGLGHIFVFIFFLNDVWVIGEK